MESPLITKKCEPCKGGTQPMNEEEIQKYLGMLSNTWSVIEGKKIKYQFKFKSFKDSIAFINKVAEIADEEGHHPDIYVFYNKVVIELWTHAIGGLSLNDFILAAKIELPERRGGLVR